MNNCLLCRDEIVHELTPQEIFTGKKIKQDFLCLRCEAEFHQIKTLHCPTCFRQQDKSKQCPDCKYWQALGYHNFKHQAIFSYNLAMHDYFKRYKRYGDYVLRLVFQTLSTTSITPMATTFYLCTNAEKSLATTTI
ncbi:hypothetical protein DS832_04305 [Bombilactobacillus bombi]|uniref:ComF family protein n=1 Tax=Bombilactobacillus bombi TaxID=1303590 RepID=A0A3R6YPQ9_9LACO|nr:hypothetical protein [Bombilactobacillus bombi]RHW47374.1 hypothetical protein DS832_04305 [Bombilactobacillus bombi]